MICNANMILPARALVEVSQDMIEVSTEDDESGFIESLRVVHAIQTITDH